MWRIIQKVFRLFLPRVLVIGKENIPPKPYIVISNHLGAKGPILLLSFWPDRLYPWIIYRTVEFKTAYIHISEDFVKKELGIGGFLSQVIGFVISLVAVPFLKFLGCIPVYKGSRRILETIRKSVSCLIKGRSIVVFCDEFDNERGAIKLSSSNSGFFKVAKRYVEITGKNINILPVIIFERVIIVGKPYEWNAKWGENENLSSAVVWLEGVLNNLKDQSRFEITK